MINNKNQLKKALKENKNNIKIKRIYNAEKNSKILINDIAEVEHVQSNAFTVKFKKYDKPAWVYYENIEVKENKIYYFTLVREEEKEKAEEIAKNENIDFIELTEEEKEKANKYSNNAWAYKIPYIINEIIEGNGNE